MDTQIDSELNKILEMVIALENKPTFDENLVNNEKYMEIMEKIYLLENIPSFNEQLENNYKFQKIVKQLEELANQPTFDEELTSNSEFTKILEHLKILEGTHTQDRYWIDFKWISLAGIILSIIGFALMLFFWRGPTQNDVETWKQNQVKRYPNNYEGKIKDDWSWYRLSDSEQGDPRGNWWVPKGFGIFWSRGKKVAFTCVIVGFVLQGIQTFVF